MCAAVSAQDLTVLRLILYWHKPVFPCLFSKLMKLSAEERAQLN